MATGDYRITFTDPSKDASGYYITVQEGTVNTVDSSLTLVGRNYPGYGQAIAQDLVHILENFSSSAPPNNPIEGQLWFDTTDPNAKKLKINDGTANAATWYPVGGVHQQATEPINTQLGDVWVDTSNNQLKIFNGADFTLIGPNYSSALKSGSYASTATDILGGSHNIVINYVNDNAVEIISQDSFTPLQVIDGFSNIKSGSNLSSKNLGTLTTPSYAQYNGVASSAAGLKQTIPTTQVVSANNFVRNDIDQKVSGVLSIGNEGGVRIGLDPTFILQRNDQSEATFLNAYLAGQNQGGSFTFKILKNNVQNTILKIDGTNDRVAINTLSPRANLHVEGTFYATGLSTFTNSLNVTGNITAENVRVNSTLTCKYEQILVGPLTIGDVNNTAVTALVPYSTSVYNIGSTDKRWSTVFANTFVGYLAGTATIATRLLQPITITLSGQVAHNPLTSSNQTYGNEGVRNLDVKLTKDAIYQQATTSTTALSDTVMLYRSTAVPDNNATGNGNLYKQTKGEFLQDLYATALWTGCVVPFAGPSNLVPSGWLKCDGTTYNITQFPALYAVIQQTYGGTGSQFQVPNLQNELGSGLVYIQYYIKT